jgi:hypothetical protein
MSTSLAYTIVVLVVAVIVGVAVAIYYYVSYTAPSRTDWVREGVKAGCTITKKNEYGMPTSFICPSGVIENITLE